MQQKGHPVRNGSMIRGIAMIGQLATGLYNDFLVSAEKEGGTKVLIRVPTGFTSVDAVLAVRVWPCFLLAKFFPSAVTAAENSCCLRRWYRERDSE